MATPFTINISQSAIDDLGQRLKTATLPISPKNADWGYGTDLAYMKRLISYWQNDFDWKKAEKELNTFDQFTADINGTSLHFIHQKSDQADAPTLLLLHGWPDSFYRFYKVIPELAKSFNVVVPSLPGFGFSDNIALNSADTAELLAKLMRDELGYTKFAVSGNDISTPIIQALASKHQKLVSTVHLMDTGYPTGSEDFSTMTPAEQAFAGKCQYWWYTEGAYNMLQSTKPQTVAFALSDSPVGLAAWLVEKFHSWSDGGIEKAFTMDEVLTNICIYYFTGTIASSLRTYAENTRATYATGAPQPPAKIEVPTAVACFAGDTVPVVEEWAKRNANVVRFTTIDRGGHFAALEVPDLFINDIVAALR